MEKKGFPTLEQVRQMNVRHGKPTAFESSSSSHGMMAFSGTHNTLTLKEADGQFVILHVHSTDMDGRTETLYSADAEIMQKLTEITDRENLYAWTELRIDPNDEHRPVPVYDFSYSAGFCIITDDRYANRFYINCETARFYGGGSVIDEVTDLMNSYLTDERKLSEKSFPPTDPRVIELKKSFFKMPMSADPPKPDTMAALIGGWKCPECNAEGNTGKFCVNCGTPRPEQTAQPEPPSEPESEWKYDGGEWKCPKCNGEGNTGKFCLNCGSWRPDLDPDKNKKTEPAPEQPSVTAQKFGIPGGITDALKAAGVFPEDKADEQLKAALAKHTVHGRLVRFKFSSWSNGMAMNSHTERRTTAHWEQDGSVTVTSYLQQGVNDALITEYKASEKTAAELEAFISECSVADLEDLTYERSKDPFAGMTDSSGGATYSIVFDDSSVGGESAAAFSIDPAAVSQHGGGELLGKLSDLTQRLCTEATLLSSRREPYRSPSPNAFMGMGMMHLTDDKWTCSECGYEGNGGKFCNNCGSPRK